ncbi:type VI secretion system amidase immunity protein Tai4 [Atlantibacter hermannii]|uniref:type VI secretion system amidase immunity protein Tai4 n=1 Tax=Atlantibacter hermannii TaxID=565 RepID=UPI0022B7BEC8|nr:type VI secretion system amidase immunity protein Tai4 [Atlantibacter hermannii]MCZ7836362.1 type VI secretion system amidase immunity protein Tai4 [Atlantibacter hermannii]
MNKCIVHVLLWALAFTVSIAQAASPQAGSRTYVQNYRDMVLATCIATAYRNDKDASADAGSSVSALRDWTYYDLDNSPDAVKQLIQRYLDQNYRNPLAESEVKNIRFDLLKCLDLYHSKELIDLADKMVINPTHSYRQDNLLSRDQP